MYGCNFLLIREHDALLQHLFWHDLYHNRMYLQAGLTPLLLAAKRGEQDLVHTLIGAKADQTVKDSHGHGFAECLNHVLSEARKKAELAAAKAAAALAAAKTRTSHSSGGCGSTSACGGCGGGGCGG